MVMHLKLNCNLYLVTFQLKAQWRMKAMLISQTDLQWNLISWDLNLLYQTVHWNNQRLQRDHSQLLIPVQQGQQQNPTTIQPDQVLPQIGNYTENLLYSLGNSTKIIHLAKNNGKHGETKLSLYNYCECSYLIWKYYIVKYLIWYEN